MVSETNSASSSSSSSSSGGASCVIDKGVFCNTKTNKETSWQTNTCNSKPSGSGWVSVTNNNGKFAWHRLTGNSCGNISSSSSSSSGGADLGTIGRMRGIMKKGAGGIGGGQLYELNMSYPCTKPFKCNEKIPTCPSGYERIGLSFAGLGGGPLSLPGYQIYTCMKVKESASDNVGGPVLQKLVRKEGDCSIFKSEKAYHIGGVVGNSAGGLPLYVCGSELSNAMKVDGIIGLMGLDKDNKQTFCKAPFKCSQSIPTCPSGYKETLIDKERIEPILAGPNFTGNYREGYTDYNYLYQPKSDVYTCVKE